MGSGHASVLPAVGSLLPQTRRPIALHAALALPSTAAGEQLGKLADARRSKRCHIAAHLGGESVSALIHAKGMIAAKDVLHTWTHSVNGKESEARGPGRNKGRVSLRPHRGYSTME